MLQRLDRIGGQGPDQVAHKKQENRKDTHGCVSNVALKEMAAIQVKDSAKGLFHGFEQQTADDGQHQQVDRGK